MADDKPPPDFMSALGAEYFVLQSTASSTISESSSRVSIYLSSLASGLVALGFSSSSPRAFASLAFTVLPTVFVLGWFGRRPGPARAQPPLRAPAAHPRRPQLLRRHLIPWLAGQPALVMPQNTGRPRRSAIA